MLILILTGGIQKMNLRSDLLFLACGLFSDGCYKARNLEVIDRDSLSALGIVGAIFSAVLASMVVLKEEGQIKDITEIFERGPFNNIQVGLLLVSVMYIIYINYCDLRTKK